VIAPSAPERDVDPTSSREPARDRRRGVALAVGCVGVAAISLVVLRVPSYDPTAWLIWGREVIHGDLSTFASPSWKPLPVAVDAVFALTGAASAPMLWLLVARSAGLAGLVLAFRVARRLGGVTSGCVAAAGLALGTDYLYNSARGDSEGLLVALALGAVWLHLERRRWPAFAFGVLAATLRPEVWLLLGAYGIWLARTARRPGERIALALSVPVLLSVWFVPDYLSTGDWLRGATRATQKEPGSPGVSAFPLGAALLESLRFLIWPMYLAAAVAAVQTWRSRRRTDRERIVLLLAAGGLTLTLEVAALAQAGFTGNIRYLTLPGAIVAVLAGVGAPTVIGELRRRSVLLVLALALATVVAAVAAFGGIVQRADYLGGEERAMRDDMRRAIEIGGGPAAVRACGRIASSPYQRSQLAYALRIHQVAVGTRASTPGTMLIRRGRPAAGARQLPLIGTTEDWIVRGSCPPGRGAQATVEH
jgi:hypothetical protein